MGSRYSYRHVPPRVETSHHLPWQKAMVVKTSNISIVVICGKLPQADFLVGWYRISDQKHRYRGGHPVGSVDICRALYQTHFKGLRLRKRRAMTRNNVNRSEAAPT